MIIHSWKKFFEAKYYTPKQLSLFKEIRDIMYIVTDEGGSYSLGRLNKSDTCILTISVPGMGSPWEPNFGGNFVKNEHYGELKDRLEEISYKYGYTLHNPLLLTTGGVRVIDLKKFYFTDKK